MLYCLHGMLVHAAEASMEAPLAAETDVVIAHSYAEGTSH